MDENIQEFMLSIVQQIGLLDLEAMEAQLKASEDARRHWDSVGVMIDPTAWIRMNSSGMFKQSEVQIEIVRHLVTIRKLIDQHQAAREGKP